MQKLKILPLLCCLLCLTSCMPQNTEIRYRLVIEGIGVDYNEDEGLYELTVQVLETSEGNPEQGKSETPVINYIVKGKTVADAINKLGENTGKYPLYSQNRLILLGSSVEGARVIKSLNFFVREYTSRPDVFVAAASGKASDVLTADASGEVTAKLIEGEIRQCCENSVSVGTELYNTVNLSLESSGSFVLPLVEVTDDRIPEKKTVKVTGAKAYSGKADSSMLSDSEAMALLFITDKIKNGSFSIKYGNIDVAFEIIRSKTKTRLTLQEGKPMLEYNVFCETDVVEFAGESFEGFDEGDIAQLERLAAEYITSVMNGLLERFIEKEGYDIFRMETIISQRYHAYADSASADGGSLLPLIAFTVNTDVDVGRIGQMTVKKSS